MILTNKFCAQNKYIGTIIGSHFVTEYARMLLICAGTYTQIHYYPSCFVQFATNIWGSVSQLAIVNWCAVRSFQERTQTIFGFYFYDSLVENGKILAAISKIKKIFYVLF